MPYPALQILGQSCLSVATPTSKTSKQYHWSHLQSEPRLYLLGQKFLFSDNKSWSVSAFLSLLNYWNLRQHQKSFNQTDSTTYRLSLIPNPSFKVEPIALAIRVSIVTETLQRDSSTVHSNTSCHSISLRVHGVHFMPGGTRSNSTALDNYLSHFGQNCSLMATFQSARGPDNGSPISSDSGSTKRTWPWLEWLTKQKLFLWHGWKVKTREVSVQTSSQHYFIVWSKFCCSYTLQQLHFAREICPKPFFLAMFCCTCSLCLPLCLLIHPNLLLACTSNLFDSSLPFTSHDVRYTTFILWIIFLFGRTFLRLVLHTSLFIDSIDLFCCSWYIGYLIVASLHSLPCLVHHSSPWNHFSAW